MAGGDEAYDDLKVHLHLHGEDHEIEGRARIGRTRLLGVLPLARELCEGVTRISLEQVARQGERVSCKAGCGACCRQLVPISPMEAVRLAQVVEAMPEARRKEIEARFAAIVRALEGSGLVDRDARRGKAALRSSEKTESARWEDASRRYFKLGQACPFLENESCSIYEERPAVCREFHVTSDPELCATLSPEARATPRPVRMSEVLTDLSNAALRRRDPNIPLALALVWARQNRKSFEAHEGDGEELAMALCEHIQAADDQ